MRVSELVTLELNHVDIDERTIRIRGKGEKDRIVLFDDATREILVEYIQKRSCDSEYIFVNRREPSYPSLCSNDDKRLC